MTTTCSPADRKPSIAAEIAGWYGMLAILGAYALNNFELLTTTSVRYQLLNLTGGLGVAWVCWHRRTWSAFCLEAAWVVIATIAIVRGALH